MKSIVVSARTIEDAISDGLSQLGCDISDCKVDIIHEGAKGLFGFFGSKPASVRLTLIAEEEENDQLDIDFSSSLSTAEPARPARQESKPAAPKAAAKPAAPKAEPKPEVKAEVKPAAEVKPEADKDAEEKAKAAQRNEVYERFHNAPMPTCNEEKKSENRPSRPARSERPARSSRPARENRSTSRDEEATYTQPAPIPTPENIEIHDPSTLEGCAQSFLKDLTTRMGVEVQIEAHRDEEGHLFVTMYGDTRGILIGRRGETLDALQYLTSLQVNRGQESYIRVTLDTENYRAKREEALSRLANRMANRAVKSGRKVSLEPMNPYERRILHASLQGHPGVMTHSEGDEPYRHVVIVPKSEEKKAQ